MSKEAEISEQTFIRLPVRVWLVGLAVAAVGGGAWYSLKAAVNQHTDDIHGLQQEAREQREIIIRIDENVKQLRRDDRRVSANERR